MSCMAPRSADQRHRLGLIVAARLGRRAFRLGKRAIDDVKKLGEVERFRQIFVGTGFGGPDRRHEGVLRAHDDDRQLRSRLLDARQHVEGVFVRHHHVGDDQIALARRDPAPQRGRIRGHANVMSRARQRLVEHGADRGIVVGDQDVAAHAHRPVSRLGTAARRFLPCRQQDAEGSPARRRIALDDAAMLADDFCHQGEPESRTVRLCGDEGIEQDRQDVLRHAWTIVADAKFQRQRNAILRARHRNANARPKGR